MSRLDNMIREVDENIERLYEMIPPEMRERIEQLKYTSYAKAEEDESEAITEDDQKRIMQEIDQFFKKGNKED